MTKFVFDDEGARIVEDFNASAGARRRRARISELLALKQGEHVLDVGSGPGHQAHEMAQVVGPSGRIAGIDATPSSVAIASDRCAGTDNVSFCVGDATALPFADGEFDAVMSSQVFEYLDDVDAALAEISRVLKSGGRALIHDTDWGACQWHARDPKRMHRILERWDAHLADPYLPRTLRSRLLNAGFVDVRVEPFVQLESRYDPTSVSAILMVAIGGYVASQGVPQTEVDEWMEDIRSLDGSHEYFFSLNEYMFVADKP